MDLRTPRHPDESRPPSLAWRCTACGFYQLFDTPAPQPAFCKLCGSLGMVTAGLGEPVGWPSGPR